MPGSKSDPHKLTIKLVLFCVSGGVVVPLLVSEFLRPENSSRHHNQSWTLAYTTAGNLSGGEDGGVILGSAGNARAEAPHLPNEPPCQISVRLPEGRLQAISRLIAEASPGTWAERYSGQPGSPKYNSQLGHWMYLEVKNGQGVSRTYTSTWDDESSEERADDLKKIAGTIAAVKNEALAPCRK